MIKTPNPTDKHVGSRVRMRRMMLSMSQEKLGDALGLTFQQVQKYEKGANRVGAGRLTQIARVLELPVSSFFNPPNPDETAASGARQLEADYFALPGAFRLVRAYAQIPQSVLRRAIIALIERLVAQKGSAADRCA